MTTIFIDADACPVTRDAISLARSRSLPVVLVANGSQNLSRYAGRTGVEILQPEPLRDGCFNQGGGRVGVVLQQLD